MKIKSVTVEVEREDYDHSHHISMPFEDFCFHVIKTHEESGDWPMSKVRALEKKYPHFKPTSFNI